MAVLDAQQWPKVAGDDPYKSKHHVVSPSFSARNTALVRSVAPSLARMVET